MRVPSLQFIFNALGLFEMLPLICVSLHAMGNVETDGCSLA